jgi:hypothetical protein
MVAMDSIRFALGSPGAASAETAVKSPKRKPKSEDSAPNSLITGLRQKIKRPGSELKVVSLQA